MNPRIVLTCAAAFLAVAARASIPEPDNLLYGSIVLSNQPVTKALSNVVVEIQRSPGGQVLASYRMGSDAGLGSFYSVRLKLEAPGPLTDTNAAQVGDNVTVVVRDNTGVRAQTNYTIVDRGRIDRLDFGSRLDDVDGNGLPDLWELAHLGSAGGNPALDTDGDGLSNGAEYLTGTDPGNAADAFRVDIQREGTQTVVSLLARRAEGPGYENLTRYYSLQNAADLVAPAWSDVPGQVNVPGDDQTLAYSAGGGPQNFYRGMVSLLPTPAAIPDTNNLPDPWEIAWFGSPGQDPNADPDGDGASTLSEYWAGTNPTDGSDAFRLSIRNNGPANEISFLARKAEGAGYTGKTRFYTLESADNSGLPQWSSVSGATNLVGDNTIFTHTVVPTNAALFFRARVELVP